MRRELKPHPDTPPHQIESVGVEIVMRDEGDVLLRFRVRGQGELSLPPRLGPGRADELSKSTCFELFLQQAGSKGYFEFNFSPSERSAAYAFDSYREGMRDLQLAVDPFVDRYPELEPDEVGVTYALDADVDLSDVPPGPLRAGLSAVIEETNGTKSYWALAHPRGRPDFHHPDCFVLELPAPSAA